MATSVAFIEAAFAKFEKDMSITEQRFLVRATRAAYKHIMNAWPMWSGFSKANNRISTVGAPIRALVPAKRIAREGAHFAQAAATERSQLAKLSRLPISKKPRARTITIGNTVDYAADLGDKGSARGFQIYATAINVARMAVRRG